LLGLHRELLEAQRIEVERFGGRMSASETLQAAVDDLRFSWIRTVSALISELDAWSARHVASSSRPIRIRRSALATCGPSRITPASSWLTATSSRRSRGAASKPPSERPGARLPRGLALLVGRELEHGDRNVETLDDRVEEPTLLPAGTIPAA
jgi:hypothetical protein